MPAGSRAAGYAPPVGAGPYRIDSVSPDGEAVLSAFDGHHAGPPAIRSVTVKFIPDSNVRFLELSAGSVNFALNGSTRTCSPRFRKPAGSSSRRPRAGTSHSS